MFTPHAAPSIGNAPSKQEPFWPRSCVTLCDLVKTKGWKGRKLTPEQPENSDLPRFWMAPNLPWWKFFSVREVFERFPYGTDAGNTHWYGEEPFVSVSNLKRFARYSFERVAWINPVTKSASAISFALHLPGLWSSQLLWQEPGYLQCPLRWIEQRPSCEGCRHRPQGTCFWGGGKVDGDGSRV